MIARAPKPNTNSMVKTYILWAIIIFAAEKFGEWKILGDLSETAKKNEGIEKLFQEKVSSVQKKEITSELIYFFQYISS